MKFENTEVAGFKTAIRGMRNPLNSWTRSDSWIVNGKFELGVKDLDLAQRLIRSGPEHCKFLRQIYVGVDITAPLYIFKEFDTYKIGTTANSTSTMHTITRTPITIDNFEIKDYQPHLILDEFDRIDNNGKTTRVQEKVGDAVNEIIMYCERLRLKYLETKDMRYWKELIRWLPESFMQTRTWSANYAVVRNMYFQRKNHKLSDWSVDFIIWVESLPYAHELITLQN